MESGSGSPPTEATPQQQNVSQPQQQQQNVTSPGELSTAAAAATDNHSGCGCLPASNITVRVTPTTGGQFDLAIGKTETVENLKKAISKKLKVPKERICLLHRDRQLREGTLHENQLMDGSRLTLLPNVETGLLAQRPEQCVMQALESLNDAQVNDFLSGKAPLNLTMRLGDHMMLIQLQLSTVTPSRRDPSAPSTSAASTLTPRNYLASSLSDVLSGMAKNLSKSSLSAKPPPAKRARTKGRMGRPATESAMEFASSFCPGDDPLRFAAAPSESPSIIKSLELAAARLQVAEAPSAAALGKTDDTKVDAGVVDKVESVDKGGSATPMKIDGPGKATTSSSSTDSSSTASTSTASTSTASTSAASTSAASTSAASNSAASTSTASTSTAPCRCEAGKPVLDTRALAQASRNLTQTLKQLSSEVLTSRDPAEECARRQGAIIESMHHHGKGVYSGTFSGTLNPALQDRFGRPKRDISTIIHILNDLLCATPQYRQRHRHAASAASAAAAASVEAPAAAPTSLEFGEGTLHAENQATRSKLERLRLVMEDRRNRRRQRRESRAAPYAGQWGRVGPVDSEPLEAPVLV